MDNIDRAFAIRICDFELLFTLTVRIYSELGHETRADAQ
jgi:hypothetical protein